MQYLFKVVDGETRTMYEICSKLTIKTPERRQWCLVSLLLTWNRFHTLFLWITLNKKILSGEVLCQWAKYLWISELARSVAYFCFFLCQSSNKEWIKTFLQCLKTQWTHGTKLNAHERLIRSPGSKKRLMHLGYRLCVGRENVLETLKGYSQHFIWGIVYCHYSDMTLRTDGVRYWLETSLEFFFTTISTRFTDT